MTVFLARGSWIILGMKQLALLPLIFLCLLATAQNPSDATTKTGCLVGNCENGTGKFRFKDNNVYEGQWKNGKQEGKGKLTLTSGAFYQGEFKAGKMQGKGKFTLDTGDYLEGDFNDDRFEGQGVFIFKNGIKMGGTYVNNTIKNGYQIFKDSSRYDGDFVANLRDGKGVMQYKDGMVYSGDWKKDKREGKGEIKDKNGVIIYSGDWAADSIMYPEKSLPVKENNFKFYADIFKRHYSGGQEIMVNGVKGGVGLEIDFTLFQDFSFSAICVTKLLIDGKTYTKKASCKGELNTKTNQVNFSEKEILTQDQIPSQLKWQYASFNLNLYADNDRKGHYLMNSLSTDGNGLRTELKDN